MSGKNESRTKAPRLETQYATRREGSLQTLGGQRLLQMDNIFLLVEFLRVRKERKLDTGALQIDEEAPRADASFGSYEAWVGARSVPQFSEVVSVPLSRGPVHLGFQKGQTGSATDTCRSVGSRRELPDLRVFCHVKYQAT